MRYTREHVCCSLSQTCTSFCPFFLFQLQEAFGWEPFTQLFAEYQTLSDIPSDNPGKMNLWVRKFSEKVQKNLAPFFEAWGWPVEKEVASSLACLPEWEGNPMRAYI